MKVDIIQIGNSKGLRIPKAILEQCDLQGRVEMDVHDNKLIIARVEVVRDGWNEAFQAMAKINDDMPIMVDDCSSKWDDEEWQW